MNITTITTTLKTDHAAQMTLEHTSLLKDQFVDMAFITRYTGLTDMWSYKQIQDGKFPHPVKFGRSSHWLKSEVAEWILGRIEEARASQVLKLETCTRVEARWVAIR